MRPFVKMLGIISVILAFILTSCFITILPSGARLRRIFLTRNCSFASRRLLALLGIRMHVRHPERLQGRSSGALVVSNHVSYIDILVIASLAPSVFITSVELGSTPFLGMLARLGGSVFVERRKAFGLKKEIAMITDLLEEGFTVVLFPEGTTSNGERVRPFKNSLFDSAVDARTNILPLCLRYTKINDYPVTAYNRDTVFYYGGETFSRHFPKLLALESVDIEVMPLKIVKAPANGSRKELALEAHAAISSAYRAE